jgi:hypothetical protein
MPRLSSSPITPGELTRGSSAKCFENPLVRGAGSSGVGPAIALHLGGNDPQSPTYELTHEYDGQRAIAKNFFVLLEAYKNHPEAKSVANDGSPCRYDTRGLLQRAHVIADWPPVYIGKESDKDWEEGEDLRLLDFKATEYNRIGNAIATEEQLGRIAKVPKREFMRRGISGRQVQLFQERSKSRVAVQALQ